MVSLTPMTGEVKGNSWILFTCSFESLDPLYITFKLTPFNDKPLTAIGTTPGSIEKTGKGASRTWYVYVQHDPCNIECHIRDHAGKELIKVVTSVTPGLPDQITGTFYVCPSAGGRSTMAFTAHSRWDIAIYPLPIERFLSLSTAWWIFI